MNETTMNKKPKDILVELNIKFNQNFIHWSSIENFNLEKSFIGLQCVAAVGEILGQQKISEHHDICCKIFDEIFSDGVSAIYLATNAMNKPAQTVLRRVLELGIAALYLWDMPHMAYSWNDYDHDLSFSEMLKHVNSKGYLAFISKENSEEIKTEIISTAVCQNIYGKLSDVVHGKIKTFESSMPDRFIFVQNEWNDFTTLFETVISVLIKAYLTRFKISDEVFTVVPRGKKEFI
ncbi:MAG: hypothetical protein PF518_12020 [Spirochaetaceae bacterium]|nr:hypothetical protein [Spirochaetaceae bacterium]